MTFEPVGIVGEACVVPGALTPAELWELVAKGRSALSRGEHPFGSAMGGYVRGFERVWDDAGFLVPPEALRGLDPVFLFSLHAAREALRSAGMSVAHEPRGAVVLGNLSYPTPAFSRFAAEVLRGGAAPRVDARNRFMSGLPASLVAEALGFGGGAFALDAACASSLYAVKLACDALHDRTADVVLAGGTNHTSDLFLHANFLALGALSPSGRSRPFHREADGLVPAQGSAMVVLMRLADAVASGRAILGVIRGVGLSNDGKSRGLLVPSEEGQVRAMRAAYEMSGLRPRDMSLVECHATGTQVGDATELRSLRAIFAEANDVPLGSLKSNLGHLITASGIAALVKVLAAMRAKVRPPTLHAEAVLDELRDGPLRVLREAEPWASDGPRRAAISNFGFGGNNAHLLVEEWTPQVAVPAQRATTVIMRAPREEIAIVAKSVVAGALRSTEEFDSAVMEGRSLVGDGEARATAFELDVGETRFPPADLAAALAQQTLMLKLAPEVAAATNGVARDRIGLLVGMQVDGEVTRLSLRIEAAAAAGSSKTPSTAAQTVGCMPNVVANRLSHQLDLRAPSFTIAAEEASGTVALSLAMRSLAAREVDVALVGAVDLSCEAVHRAAAEKVLPERRTPGDAAVLFALKRLADARDDGDRVLAVLDHDDSPGATGGLRFAVGDGESDVAASFGHAHAASGLLQVAAAVAACERRARPARAGLPPMPWFPVDRERRARVDVHALGGGVTATSLRSDGASTHSVTDPERPCVVVFGGADRSEVLRALERRAPTDRAPGHARMAIVAPNAAAVDERIELAARLLRESEPAAPFVRLDDGIYFGTGAVPGEVAFVFTGPAGAYPHMGRELALALPELVDALARKSTTMAETVGFVYDDPTTFRASTFKKLTASAYLTYLHAELTHGLLGITPQASIGYCSGETFALFALGAWTDFDEFRHAIDDTGVFTRELAGDLRALRRAWGAAGSEPIGWATYRVLAPVATVRDAVASEPRAHLTIVNSPHDVIIAGDPAACERVAARVGPMRARSLDYDMVMHCPEAKAFEEGWRSLHHRRTSPVPSVRFYTHATCASYTPTDDAVADALVGQAMNLVDFPKMIERAYADGVRVFVEHGPHAGCTKWIGDILGERPHVAVALDRFGRSSCLQAIDSVAALVAAGVPMNHRAVAARLGPPPARPPVAQGAGAVRSLRLTFAAHPAEEAQAPPTPAAAARLRGETEETDERAQRMEPAPRLPRVRRGAANEPAVRSLRSAVAAHANGTSNGAGNGHASSGIDDVARVLIAHTAELAELHTEFLRRQAAVQDELVRLCLGVGVSADVARAHDDVPAKVDPKVHDDVREKVHANGVGTLVRRTPTGPRFSRAQLETLAGGKISDVFGPLFEKQDGYHRQVRLPQPPFLLADRVTGLEGEAGSMGTATIWTETDITPDAFYLHEGRMPATIFVEGAQADVLLVSWLGADFHNRGERVYRLLGCDMVCHGELPKVGDKLEYEIRIDGHARQGDVRIFSFSSECHIDGKLRLSVTNGQAGFFSDEELASSSGTRWSPEDSSPVPAHGARVEPPPIACTRSRFGADAIAAFAAGRTHECFGPGFERAATHTRTPCIPSGPMRVVDEVTHFDPSGGPWGRGTLRARLAIRPDHWFFDGHFKNDPCMPGTLMVEGGLQAMAIYLGALGFTVRRDGWRFEVVPHERYALRCRGQVTPSSKELVYELFVHEVFGGPTPTLFASVLGSVDGLKAFHFQRLGLRLVPGWPSDEGRLTLPASARDTTRPSVRAGRVVFDEGFMHASALGRPSAAYGEEFAVYDAGRTMPRTPGPPYTFMSRIVDVQGELGAMKTGCSAVVEFDIPEDAWFRRENHAPVVPLAALLEIALQPCGWLGTFAGCALTATEDVAIRNLDGVGTLYREVGEDVRMLSTTTSLKSLSTAGSLTIVGFDVTIKAGEDLVYACETVFGFFTQAALENQVGLPTTDAERARLDEPSDVAFDVRLRPPRLFGGPLHIATEKLLMIDRVTGLWPTGGRAGLGRIRTEKDVLATDWFFKAHFFQDPVQPGSLGIEAMVQAVQILLIERGVADGMASPAFDAALPDLPMTWKYRGQVVPENDCVVVDVELTSLREDGASRIAIADATLWVDKKKIYSAHGLAVRLGPRRS